MWGDRKHRPPEQYLAHLPEDRVSVVHALRSTIIENLPDGFEETMAFSMLGYVVPLDRYPGTYNGQPLGAIALSNQKNHVAVYLMGIYADDDQRKWFVDAWTAAGKKLDMGKSCVRLKTLDDVAFGVLGQAVARVTPNELIRAHEQVHGRR